MNTHEALLRLGRNRDDGEALISVYEQNEKEIAAAIIRWLGLEDEFERARRAVLFEIALTARYYLPEVHDATDWIRERANLECRRLYLQRGVDNTREANPVQENGRGFLRRFFARFSS